MTLPQQPQQTGPHVVHFSPVKEVVEIESGRFEFFKQMLTLALGGIAGLAAIFTEPEKIPEEIWSRAALSVFAICAILVVIFSAMGISTYANHLRDVEKLSHDPTNAELKNKRTGSGTSMIHHAQVALIASGVGAMALIFFAGLKLVQPMAIGAEAAMRTAREIVSRQPGNPAPESLDHFQTSGADYLITYVTSPTQAKYTVRINRDNNRILEITKP